MIERFEPTDAHDRRLVPGLDGLLGAFNAAGVLAAADVHTALRLGELVGEDDERLRLGVALAVRAARHGSVCVDLTGIADGDDLPWPDGDGWADDLAVSAFAASSVARVEHGLVYLDRYWREEGQVRDDLVRRAEATPPVVDDALLEAHAGTPASCGSRSRHRPARPRRGCWSRCARRRSGRVRGSTPTTGDGSRA